MAGRGRGGSRRSKACINGSPGCNGNRCLQCGNDRRQRERDDRLEALESATNRPAGELDAGIGAVDGYPALYEQGGQNGDPSRIDVYFGPHGPLGDPHGHMASNNGGVGADYVREPDGEVRSDSRGGRRRRH